MSTDWNATSIEWNGGGLSGNVKFGNDRNLLVMFYNKSVEVPSESIIHGRRWCRNEVYVKIQHPGENFNVIDRPASDQDKQRFRDQWSKFVQDRTQIPEGTSIDMLFPNHPAVGENLKGYGIYTIEQCAALSASAIDNIGRGGQEYVNRAQSYLSQADKGKGFHKLQKSLDDERVKVRVLERQVTDLKNQMDIYLMKVGNQPGESLNPKWIPGFDAQTERINANHPTQEIATTSRKKKKRAQAPVETEPYDPITDPLHQVQPAVQEQLDNDHGISGTTDQDR